MTTFYTDITALVPQIKKSRIAEWQVWRLFALIPALFTRTAPDGQEILAKAARREAARRSVDNLLR